MTEAPQIIGQRTRPVRAWTDLRRLRRWGQRVPLAFKICVMVVAVYFALCWLTDDGLLLNFGFKDRIEIALTLAGIPALGLLRRVRWGSLRRILNERFARDSYDERRIMSDLSYAARAVATRRQLFELMVGKIQEALDPASIAIFVRDDKSGEYVCEISSAWLKDGDYAETTREPSAQPLALSSSAFVIRRLGRLSMPLTICAEDYEAWMRSLATASQTQREARRREQETLESVGASLLFPIMMKDELVGLMTLGARRAGRPYSAEDKHLLLSVAGQLAFVIENTKLAARIVEEERLRREIRMASEVQRRLFPARPPESKWLEVSGSCQPARGVGGDYYDFLTLDEHLTGVAVADVAGKGISAALLMSIVQASLRSQAASAKGGSLAELTSNMNQLMYGSTGASSFASFFYAQFDARTHQLTYVNAGHNPPLLWRARADEATIGSDDAQLRQSATRVAKAFDVQSAATFEDAPFRLAPTRVEMLTVGGPVIGVLDGCRYEQETVEMRSGDVLLAYTDGVTEALNEAGEEFGEERLVQTLAESAHLTANELRIRLVQSVSRWSGSAPQHDDLTVLVLKVK